MRHVLVCVVLFAACSSNTKTLGPDAPAADATPGPPCTGAVYDPCTSNTQCTSMNCHLYNSMALQVCTTACSATTPCPNDSAGNPVTCNMMGNCKPTVANNCTR